MLRGLYCLSKWFLVLALSHTPIPWFHSHEYLSPEQLVVHLQQYHSNCPPGELPHGWHLHCIDVGQADPGSEVKELQAIQGAELRTLLLIFPTQQGIVSSAVRAVANRAIHAIGSLHRAFPKQELFKQYGAFLV